ATTTSYPSAQQQTTYSYKRNRSRQRRARSPEARGESGRARSTRCTASAAVLPCPSRSTAPERGTYVRSSRDRGLRAAMRLSGAVALVGFVAGCSTLKPNERFRQCECPEGYVCNTGRPPPFCRPAHSSGLGEPCSDLDNCQSGLVCNFGFPHGRCEPPYQRREG